MSAYFFDRSRQFGSFFPFFRTQLAGAAANCSRELEAYWTHVPDVPLTPGCAACGTRCALALSCILSHLQEHIKANMASATILLGFVPTILSLLGPSFEETIPFMLSRPIFASCLLIGTPAISPMAIFTLFSHSDVTGTVIRPKQTSRVMTEVLTWLVRVTHQAPGATGNMRHFWMTIVCLVEFVLVGLAVFNTLRITLLLDLQTIVVWRCGMSGQVLLWLVLGLPVRWFGAMGFVLPISWGNLATWPDALKRACKAEITPSFFRTKHDVETYVTTRTVYSELTYWSASILGLAHYGYGTLLFSSLLFISVSDAGQQMALYGASIFCCRIVLLFELECMKFQWYSRSAINQQPLPIGLGPMPGSVPDSLLEGRARSQSWE